jgi:hypothetical protein
VVVVVSSWALANPDKSKPRIEFGSNEVLATGITPGGSVAWFSVAREAAPFVAVMARREAIVTDSGGSGTVSFDVGKPVPECSISVAVDLASGDFAVASPPSYPLREVALSPGAFRNAPNGKLARVVQDSHLLEVFVARPGVGAWVAMLTDQEDQTAPTHGSVAVALERLQPVGPTTAAPDEFSTGDVFVAIDPERMTVASVRATGPKK